MRHGVRAFHAPGGLGIRVESALEVGDAIAIEDEPLLAKVLAHGTTRVQALSRLAAALTELVIDGVPTNLSLLQRVLAEPELVRGPVHTNWLEAHAEPVRTVRSSSPRAPAPR